MADTKLSDLTAVTDVLPGDEYLVARSGASKKITAANLAIGMGAGGFTLIERKVLGSDVASTTFSSLGSYEDLMLVWSARGTDSGNPNLNMQFNADTGSNYDSELLIGVGSSATAAATNGAGSIAVVGALPGSGAPSGRCGSGKIVIPGYRRTVFHKSVTAEFADLRGTTSSDALAGVTGGLWRNTAAITSVTLLATAGNLLTGSVFSLYGTL